MEFLGKLEGMAGKTEWIQWDKWVEILYIHVYIHIDTHTYIHTYIYGSMKIIFKLLIDIGIYHIIIEQSSKIMYNLTIINTAI